jgi:hypothetical protein
MPTKRKATIEQEKIAEAIDYKLQGFTYEAIAEAMQIKLREAKRLVYCGLSQIVRNDTQDEQLTDLERIDQMLAHMFPLALEGDKEAIERVTYLRSERKLLEEKLLPKCMDPHFQTIRTLVGPNREHIPNEFSISIVRGLALCGVPKERIASHLGLHVDTVTQHYDNIIEHAREYFLAIGVDSLNRNVLAGKESSTFFLLKTQGHWHEVHPPDSRPHTEIYMNHNGVTVQIKREELARKLEERGLPPALFGVDLPELPEPELIDAEPVEDNGDA